MYSYNEERYKNVYEHPLGLALNTVDTSWIEGFAQNSAKNQFGLLGKNPHLSFYSIADRFKAQTGYSLSHGTSLAIENDISQKLAYERNPEEDFDVDYRLENIQRWTPDRSRSRQDILIFDHISTWTVLGRQEVQHPGQTNLTKFAGLTSSVSAHRAIVVLNACSYLRRADMRSTREEIASYISQFVDQLKQNNIYTQSVGIGEEYWNPSDENSKRYTSAVLLTERN